MDRIISYLTKIPPGPLVGVVAIAALWFMSGAPDAAHHVPDLEGMQVNPAIAEAAREGFFTKVVFERSGGVAGTVVRQSPDELTIHEKGTTIVLRVTKGAPQIAVPNVKGLDVEEARRRLDRSHMGAGTVTYKKDDNARSNTVITTVPKAGTLVDVGTEVEIVAAA